MISVRVQQNLAEPGQFHSLGQLSSHLMDSFAETGINFGFFLWIRSLTTEKDFRINHTVSSMA